MKKIALSFVLWSSMLAHSAASYQAGEQQSLVCSACHGAQGISTNPIWPNIAGQHISYLEKQLFDIQKNQTRHAPTMLPIVAQLNEEDMQSLAIYFSKQPISLYAVPKKYLARGEQLYRGGDFKKHITACIACHGPRGMGNAQANFPVLSGQRPLYTIQQLEAFKKGERKNDLNGIMRDISARMSEEDMAAIAYYVSGLH